MKAPFAPLSTKPSMKVAARRGAHHAEVSAEGGAVDRVAGGSGAGRFTGYRLSCLNLDIVLFQHFLKAKRTGRTEAQRIG